MARRKYRFDPPQTDYLRRGNQDFFDVWSSRGWGAVHSIKYSAMVIALQNWETVMARRTYRIELKIDLSEEDSHAVMLDIAKRYARDLLASSTLLSEKNSPKVALMTDDSFHGQDEIDLMEPSETLHT
jgi:hypothetical protein